MRASLKASTSRVEEGTIWSLTKVVHRCPDLIEALECRALTWCLRILRRIRRGDPFGDEWMRAVRDLTLIIHRDDRRSVAFVARGFIYLVIALRYRLDGQAASVPVGEARENFEAALDRGGSDPAVRSLAALVERLDRDPPGQLPSWDEVAQAWYSYLTAISEGS